MNMELEIKGLDQSDNDGWSVYSLLDSLTQRIENDIDRYSAVKREMENLRFIVITAMFFIYSILSFIMLQIDIDNGIGSQVSFFSEDISKRIVFGTIIAIMGLFIIIQVLYRLRPGIKTMKYTRSYLKIRAEFGKQVVKRVTTWESRFKGDFYEKSILRLKIETLVQLLDELDMIVLEETQRRPLFFRFLTP